MLLIIPIAISVLIALIAFAVLRKIAVPAFLLLGGLYIYATEIQPAFEHEPAHPTLTTEQVAASSIYNPLHPDDQKLEMRPSPQPLSPAATPVDNPFQDGRSDRASYDAWFSGLSPGPYQDGALFWASHRSLKVQPPCHAANGDMAWESGCLAGKVRLNPSDKRRPADPAYRSGWNSLG